MNNTKKALEQAIQYLRMYAAEDDIAGLNGSGCYSNPSAMIGEWIKNIKRIENGEQHEV